MFPSFLVPVQPENDLYSATSLNFLGSEPVVLRSSNLALRTEFKSSWLSGEFLCKEITTEKKKVLKWFDD